MARAKGITLTSVFLVILAIVCTTIQDARSQSLPAAVNTITIASGLTRPVFMTAPPADYNRLFIVEQQIESPPSSGQWIGRIRIVHFDTPPSFTPTLNATPFLTVTGLAGGNEQGLLGLAFDPDYATNGKFYVHYTASNRDIVIAQYQVSAGNADIADTTPANIKEVLRFSHPQDNHNAGWIGFSPRPADDHNLYISSGDGGGSDDNDAGHASGGNGQSNQTLLGKMLRIHVDPATGTYTIPSNNPFAGMAEPVKDEIWLMGLRNPYRDSFDRLTGRMIIGDVGQNTKEEVDVQQPTNPGGGENYGWPIREGLIANPAYTPTPTPTPPAPPPPTLIDPILDYPRTGTAPADPIVGTTVTGGYFYRGRQIPALRGIYFFGDYSAGKIFSVNYDGATVSNKQTITSLLFPTIDSTPQNLGNPSSFGEDANGELYISDLFPGRVYKIIPTTPNVEIDSVQRSGNSFVLHGYGVPFKAHTVRAVADITQPFDPTTNIGTATATEDGSFQFTDPNPSNLSTRFYQVVYP